MSVPVFSIHVRGAVVALAWIGLLAAEVVASPNVATSRPVAAVDERVELRVGEVTITRYLVEKNLARFREDFLRRMKREPGADELAHWIERFAAQQGLIAAALREGFDTRPEVGATVDRMERHMLTNPDGPFYAWLLDESDDAEAATVRAMPAGLRRCTATWARFPHRAHALTVLGTDFPALDFAGKRSRLESLRKNPAPHVRVFHGDLQWPWEPFPELGAVLAATPAGATTELASVAHGVAVVAVHELDFLPPGMPAAGPDPRWIRATQLRVLFNRRQIRALAELRATVDLPALARLWERLAPADLFRGTIPDDALRELSSLRLVRGVEPEAGTSQLRWPATAGEWQRYFNRLLIRRVPRDVEDLRESVEAMLREEFDCRGACAVGIDATAKFRADRGNFRRAQVLQIFLRERISPPPGGPAGASPGVVGGDDAAAAARELERGWAALRDFDVARDAEEFVTRWRSLLATGEGATRAGDATRPVPLSPHVAETSNPKNIP